SPQGVERNHPEEADVPERSTPEETPRRGTDPSAPPTGHTRPPDALRGASPNAGRAARPAIEDRLPRPAPDATARSELEA
ncbi:hypothetical protein, partial [Streptomyces sp. NPDC002994]|uniref:hypothetical protein n=1 Tax=Streptomyces sp. NPDC002994 TaxID=3154441 RepID=UPI0033A8070B